MPFDALAMAAMTDEVTVAAGGRIQKIVQPSAHAVGLAVYAGGEQRWLLLSADARFARVQLTGRLAKAFPTPSSFVMLLRKYLDAGRLDRVEQSPHDRVMTIHCRGREGTVRLVCEVMGKHSNVILVDGRDRILGAVKLVQPAESRVRPILPGRLYSQPPEHGRDERLFSPGPRLDPAATPEAVRDLLAMASQAPATSALLGLLSGCGPFLAEQISLRAGVGRGALVSEAGPDRLVAAARSLFDLYRTRAWEPATFLDARGRRDYSPYPPLGAADSRHAASLSDAIAAAVEDVESHDALGSLRTGVVDEIGRALRSAERRASSLNEGLEATSEAETYMTEGQLVLSYAYSIGPEQKELVLPEMEIVIPLDPALTPAQNAERYFRRYRKLRDARERIPGLLREATAEAERLRDLLSFARMAESEGELRSLQKDVRPQAERKQPRRSQPRGPRRFTLGDFIAIVGRNARENEEVTFRLSNRGDLWLHARERTGAHVIVHGGREPDDAVVEAAAALAAHFSEARNDTAVDVVVAPVREVRKIPGGPPGRVTYRNSRTVRVRPAIGDWTPDR
jgi:predicted ribosome quality control (RQC) complex YloA/Tae2 family protein